MGLRDNNHGDKTDDAETSGQGKLDVRHDNDVYGMTGAGSVAGDVANRRLWWN